MSQDAITNPMLLSSLRDASFNLSLGEDFRSGEETPTGQFLVDSYADRLMDDLFEDVEEMLGGRPKQPEPPEQIEESISSQPDSANFIDSSTFEPSLDGETNKPQSEVEAQLNLGLRALDERLANSALEKLRL